MTDAPLPSYGSPAGTIRIVRTQQSTSSVSVRHTANRPQALAICTCGPESLSYFPAGIRLCVQVENSFVRTCNLIAGIADEIEYNRIGFTAAGYGSRTRTDTSLVGIVTVLQPYIPAAEREMERSRFLAVLDIAGP